MTVCKAMVHPKLLMVGSVVSLYVAMLAPYVGCCDGQNVGWVVGVVEGAEVVGCRDGSCVGEVEGREVGW